MADIVELRKAVQKQIDELLQDAKGRRLVAEDWNTPEGLEEGLNETARIEEDSADMLHNLLARLTTHTTEREAERAAIVAWLRKIDAAGYAAAIQRGDHLKGI